MINIEEYPIQISPKNTLFRLETLILYSINYNMSKYDPQNSSLNRFQVKNLWRDILKILNLEKGILFTVYALTVRPGETINQFLFEDRSKLTKPFPFLIVTVTIITFLTVNFLDLEGAFMAGANVSDTEQDPAKMKYFETLGDMFMQGYNIIQLLSVPFLAFASYLMFRSHRYNYAEHVVIAAYLTGMLATMYIIGFPLAYWNYMIFSAIIFVLFAVYSTIVYIRVFGEPMGEGIPKGIAVQVIYYISFFFVMMVVMLGIAVFLVYKLKMEGG